MSIKALKPEPRQGRGSGLDFRWAQQEGHLWIMTPALSDYEVKI